jgi:hypothetical protein
VHASHSAATAIFEMSSGLLGGCPPTLGHPPHHVRYRVKWLCDSRSGYRRAWRGEKSNKGIDARLLAALCRSPVTVGITPSHRTRPQIR